MDLGKKMAPNDTQLQISLDDKPLSQVPSATLLGLEIDQNLTFCEHTDKLCKKRAKRIGILNTIKCYMSSSRSEIVILYICKCCVVKSQ